MAREFQSTRTNGSKKPSSIEQRVSPNNFGTGKIMVKLVGGSIMSCRGVGRWSEQYNVVLFAHIMVLVCTCLPWLISCKLSAL